MEKQSERRQQVGCKLDSVLFEVVEFPAQSG